MNDKLTNRLKEQYPVLFENLRLGQFECGDGWYDLIEEFANVASSVKAPVTVLVVKEKLGGLRIQGLTNMTDELYEKLWEIEAKSYHVCEECGAPGELCGTKYYVSTRCPEHRLTHRGEVMKPKEIYGLNSNKFSVEEE